MEPTKCNVCQSDNLYHGRTTGIYSNKPIFTPFKFIRPIVGKAAICLSCGSVQHYMTPEELERVKDWKTRGL